MNTGIHLDLILVFFIYGLGFFCMGLSLVLEAGRASALIETRLLIPLALFGIIHGLHEWLEIFLLEINWLGGTYPNWVAILRLVILAVSFIILLVFGLQTSFLVKPSQRKIIIPAYALLGVYLLGILFSGAFTLEHGNIPPLKVADAMIRYLLAVSGAGLASLGLRLQAMDFKAQGRNALANSINLAVVGFVIYGVTQVFVPAVDMVPARLINADVFASVMGFPVQLVRGAMAILIMVGILRATNLVDKERQGQLVQAQQARLEALERIQEENLSREVLRRDLLRHVVRAQEDERARIARELHDETSQVLSALSLDLATLKQLSSRNKEIRTMVDRLQKLGRMMSQGLFRLVHDLRPAQLDELGLASALHTLMERGNCPPGLDVSLEVSGRERRLDPVVETVLFRVAQEALNNISRHAGVDSGRIHLLYEPDLVTLCVEDNGVGFDPSLNFSPPRGWGLAGMQERIDSVNGKLNILSSPGKGTIIEVIIPMDAHTSGKKE